MNIPASPELDTSIECVLFDLDGTLIDTAVDFVKVLDLLLAEYDKPKVDKELIYQTVSDGARALVKLGFEVDETHADFSQYVERLLNLYDSFLENTEATLYPGMASLLDALEAKNIPWGIVTNKPEQYTLTLLNNLSILPRCQCVICPEHVEHKKPHPESILLACERFDVDTERVVYVGDHLRDIQAAKNADVIAIAAAYGYISPSSKPQDWYADFILQKPQNLTSLLNLLKFA